MNINGISSTAVAAIDSNNTPGVDAVAIAVLKKAMDADAAQAQQLIAALPEAGSSLGHSLDVHA